MRFMARGWLLAVASLLLAACGGGGGGSSTPELVLSTRTVSVAGTTDDSIGPLAQIGIHLKNVGQDDLVYINYGYEGGAIEAVDLYSTSDTDGSYDLQMKAPAGLEPGTYTDTATLEFCEDEACTREYKGSPATIAVTYTVTQGTRPPTAISVSPDHVDVTSEIDQYPPTTVVTITTINLSGGMLYFQANTTYNGLSGAYLSYTTNTQTDLQLSFNYGLAEGTYHDTVTVIACYDSSCSRQVQGSPKQIAVTYTVTPRQPAAPDRAVLPTTSIKALSHDVIDAEFSSSLNAVVMVSSMPSNALYLYALSDGSEQKLALDKLPTAVSVSPDGKAAAVGHDALITYVDLGKIATPSAAKKLLNVSTKVFDLVLDGNGWVDAFPAADQWVQIHAVKVATNVETLATSQIYAGTRAKLHPDGKSLYNIDYDGLDKYDVSAGVPSFLYSSGYYSGFPTCSDLWMSEDGASIYTACGNVFQSTATQSTDMKYAGAMQITGSTSANNYTYYRIASLSQSGAKKEIALIERDSSCESNDAYSCRDYYDLFESQFLNQTATYSIPPMTVAGKAYVQRGLFTFYSGDGNKRVLISKLLGMSDSSLTYYLSTLN